MNTRMKSIVPIASGNQNILENVQNHEVWRLLLEEQQYFFIHSAGPEQQHIKKDWNS